MSGSAEPAAVRSVDMGAVEASLKAFARVRSDQPGRAAAVAIALAATSDGTWCFPLTVRASGLRVHAGQFALPGGRISPGESAVEAAARETAEELGLDESQWRRHYLLDDYVTRSGHVITPVVLVSEEPAERLDPNPAEVDEAFYVPVGSLGATEPGVAYDHSGDRAFALHVASHLVFAPTGAILLQFRDLALSRTTTRVQHVGEPVFAWK